MASVKWSADALQDLERIDKVIARRIVEKIAWFEEHFSDIVPEPLNREFRGLTRFMLVHSIRA